MKIKKLSSKQKQLFYWCHGKNKYDNIIADGAVRSGKTIIMAISFIHWAMRYFKNSSFAFAGKTIKSTERNIIIPVLNSVDLTDYFDLYYSKSGNYLIVKSGDKTNIFYLFGGKDEGSYSLIQGITLSGVLFDEVALMPKSFVEQAIARTLSEKNAKLWFNCNPENPNHWFYKEWIRDADGKNQKNSLHIHFLMSDNPALSNSQLEKSKNLYTGVFYDRYIKGLWVRAEGKIYPEIAHCITKEKNIRTEEIDRCIIGLDFGGNRSLTTFVATGILKDFKGIVALKDHAIKGKKGEIDCDKICRELYEFILSVNKEFDLPVFEVRADCAEQYLINSLNNFLYLKRLNIPVKDSKKVHIIDRIRCTDALIKSDRLKICQNCRLLINGIENAVWDKDAAEKGLDVRLDDFTSDIDILDAFEYSFSKYISRLTPKIIDKVKDNYGLINPAAFLGGWE